MRARPEGVEESAIVEALREHWGVDTDAIEYAPVGFGSYHWVVEKRWFVTVDDLDVKTWLGDERDVVFDGLRRAFDVAVALRDAGLPFVVAPTPSLEGESAVRLGPRHTIALFPFVEGKASDFGEHELTELPRIVAMLAELHGRTDAVRSIARSAGVELSGRRHIEAALGELDRPWRGGPLSEQTRHALAGGAAKVAELLELHDRRAARATGGWVVTHGEPHAANILRPGESRMLVDWDTVALAPPERDLWMVGEPELYAEATGIEPDPDRLELFRLMWDLKDLAEYLNVLRAPHEESGDTLKMLEAVSRWGA